MNPLTNMKNVKKLSEQELGKSGKSWHDQYRQSAWIFVGGFSFDLTEGDIICIFSQYGEIVNINLIRDKDTGKSRGFCFICYEDQRSTDLAVDNFNGIKIMNRTIRVDHVSDYKMPKDSKKVDDETRKLHEEGCAPKPAAAIKPLMPRFDDFRETLADQIVDDIKLPPRLPIYPIKQEIKSEGEEDIKPNVKVEVKKEKEREKSKKKKSKRKSSSSSIGSDSDDEKRHRKKKHKKHHRT